MGLCAVVSSAQWKGLCARRALRELASPLSHTANIRYVQGCRSTWHTGDYGYLLLARGEREWLKARIDTGSGDQRIALRGRKGTGGVTVA